MFTARVLGGYRCYDEIVLCVLWCGGDRELIGVLSSEYVGSCVCVKLLIVLMVLGSY